MQVSPQTFVSKLAKAKHSHLPSHGFDRVPVPTPDEIRERCLAIQREWTPWEEMDRRRHRAVCEVPQVKVGRLSR